MEQDEEHVSGHELRKGPALFAALSLEARVVSQGICNLVDSGLQCFGFGLKRVGKRRRNIKDEEAKQGAGMQGADHCHTADLVERI
jgi:hypothetical protein